MTPEEIYPQIRARLCDLAATLPAEQLLSQVPALPAWTVRDVFGHLAGVCADVYRGNVEGAATSQWTQAQVDERRDLSVAEVAAPGATIRR
jgi:hypothetical protein